MKINPDPNQQITTVHGSYDEKLKILGLDRLNERRKMLDMCQTFKIVKGIDNVKSESWFELYGENTGRTKHGTSAICTNRDIQLYAYLASRGINLQVYK